MADDVPPGFALIETSAFIQHLGGLYRHPETGVFGMRTLPEHANAHLNAHGGFLATLVDVAVSRGTRLTLGDGSMVSTVTMTLNYLEPVPMGSWVEARPSLDRAGSRTVFTSCEVSVGELLVARATAVLARHRPKS